MSKFLCKCGELLSNSTVPNDIEFWVYSDFEWDKIMEKDSYLSYEIPSPTLDVWKCPKCQRVYVFEVDKLIRTYAIEKDRFSLLRSLSKIKFWRKDKHT